MPNTVDTKVIEILTTTKALLASKAQWTKEYYARNALGWQIEANSPHAVCWCFQGALGRAAREVYQIPVLSEAEYEAEAKAEKFVDAAIHKYFFNNKDITGIISFNDHPTTKFSDVHMVLDTAIQLAEAKAAE